MSPKASHGLLWVAGGVLARGLSHGATLILMLVAARMLSPEDFGTFVLSTAIVAFGMLFIYAGVYEYLLRVDEEALQKNAAFSVLFVVAATLAVLHLLGAQLAARLFQSPVLADILFLFAVIPLAGSLSAWREALYLRHSHQVGRYNAVVISRDLLSLGVGLAGLWWGWGLAALVAWRLSMALIGWAMWRALVRERPQWDFRWASWRQVVAYGGGIMGSRLAAFAEANGVDILLGLLLQPGAVGLYRMASRVVATVVDLLAQPLGKLAWVRVSEAARLGHAPQQECAIWHRLMLVLAWPVLAWLGLEARTLTAVLLGERWLGAAPVMTALAVAALVRTSVFSVEPLFAAQGHSVTLWRLRVMTALLSLSFVLLGTHGELALVAWGQPVAACLGMVLILRAAQRQACLSLRQWGLALWLPLSGLAVLTSVSLAAHQMLPLGRTPNWTASAVTALVAVFWMALALWQMRGQLRGVAQTGRPAASSGGKTVAVTPG